MDKTQPYDLKGYEHLRTLYPYLPSPTKVLVADHVEPRIIRLDVLLDVEWEGESNGTPVPAGE